MLRKAARRIIDAAVYAINRVGDRLEPAFADTSDRPLAHVPVLILGAPRCGSTLLFQAMTEVFDFGYLSNTHCRFFGAPSVVERIARASVRRGASDYTSDHGVIAGRWAPSECGAFWYRFFRRRPQYVPLADAAPRQMRRLRGAMRALVNAMARPVLFKNLHCTLRLEPIARALPEAVFITIRREEVDNAHSLLETRRQVYGSYEHWWSMEPPEIDALKSLPAHEQVVEQIRRIQALLDRDRASIAADRFLDVSYEEFCDAPSAVLERIRLFLAAHGAAPAVRGKAPEKFPRRQNVKIDAHLFERMREYAERTSERTFAS